MSDRPTPRPGREPPGTEIEVTPEMAKAGAKILAERYDALGDFIEEISAEMVYRAMIAERDSE